MFDLKRPCVDCPFKKGNGSSFGLHPERLDEIVEATAFQCHKTIDYEHWSNNYRRQGPKPQQCAGLMAVLDREKKPNQIMQVARRLGLVTFNPRLLDPDKEAYETIEQARAAHIEGIEP